MELPPLIPQAPQRSVGAQTLMLEAFEAATTRECAAGTSRQKFPEAPGRVVRKRPGASHRHDIALVVLALTGSTTATSMAGYPFTIRTTPPSRRERGVADGKPPPCHHRKGSRLQLERRNTWLRTPRGSDLRDERVAGTLATRSMTNARRLREIRRHPCPSSTAGRHACARQ